MKKLITGLVLVLFAVCSLAQETLEVAVTVTHDTPDTVAEYDIMWASSNGESGREIVKKSDLPWTHKNLEAGQTIDYVAFAINELGYYSTAPSPKATVPIVQEAVRPDNPLSIPIHIAPVFPAAPGANVSCSVNAKIKCAIE